ncbi:MAG: DUF4185 domain-containing protein [Microthrixaceae bacterium]
MAANGDVTVRTLATVVASALLVAVLGGCAAEDRAAAGERTTTTAGGGPAATVRPVLGPVGPTRPVGPPPTDPLARVDRDAGVSARLRDGSVVWFFGDTGVRNPDDSLAWFEIGSAAWAPAATPTVTRDVAVGGRALPFAAPTPDFPPCPPEAPVAGMWPAAAVTVPEGAVDQVLLWMANICLGSNRAAVSRGISLGRWTYDPAGAPPDGPVRVTVLQQRLFPDDALGEAAADGGDGFIYTMGCAAPPRPGWATEYGPCRVARVRPDDAADRAAYEVWTGRAWEAGGVPAPVELGGDGHAPPGPVSIARRPDGTWVMLYTPWPGYVGTASFRTATRPEGPWSAPVELTLPGCTDTYRGVPQTCYAVNLQPALDDGRSLAFGYYDKQVAQPPLRGAFLVTSVPFRAVPDR